MSSGQYFKFWANSDNSAFLNSLPNGQKKGTVINEAVRYYANMQSHTANIVDSANLAQSPSVLRESGAGLSANVVGGSSQVMLASVSPSSVSGNFIPLPPAPISAICPSGHLWMNGTQRCVNRKCAYGKTE